MNRKVYIRASSQISVQEPLCEEWMEHPKQLSGPSVRCIDPDYKQFFSPMQARRMGPMFKRAMVTSRKVLETSGISCPDAIITGTALGCIGNTESFLDPMCREGESGLSPTAFMQSTHNTIGSMVAIALGCHGYNCTYSQDGVSFESALLDAVMQLETGEAGNALVGAHDEITDNVAHLRDAIEPEGYPFTEGSVAMMLVFGGRPDDVLCEVADVRILSRPDVALEAIKEYDAEYVMRNDVTFSLFGRCGSASGLAVHAAANMIAAGRYSSVLVVNESGSNAGLVFLKKV